MIVYDIINKDIKVNLMTHFRYVKPVEIKPDKFIDQKFIIMTSLQLKLNVTKESYQCNGHQRFQNGTNMMLS